MRKKQQRKKNNGFFTIKIFILMLFMAFGAIFYVWQRATITQLGYKIREKEVQLEKMLDDRARLQSVIARMESPSNIDRLLASLKLNIGQSKTPKVVKVKL